MAERRIPGVLSVRRDGDVTTFRRLGFGPLAGAWSLYGALLLAAPGWVVLGLPSPVAPVLLLLCALITGVLLSGERALYGGALLRLRGALVIRRPSGEGAAYRDAPRTGSIAANRRTWPIESLRELCVGERVVRQRSGATWRYVVYLVLATEAVEIASSAELARATEAAAALADALGLARDDITRRFVAPHNIGCLRALIMLPTVFVGFWLMPTGFGFVAADPPALLRAGYVTLGAAGVVGYCELATLVLRRTARASVADYVARKFDLGEPTDRAPAGGNDTEAS